MRVTLVAMCLGQSASLVTEHEVPQLVSSTRWKNDCKQRHKAHPLVTSVAQVNKSLNPGAGVEGYDSIKPYTMVYNDGFAKVDCVKDAMFEFGDKFGDNRHAYRMGDVANTSIVRYSDIVPKEDRKKMSSSVCFEFCRGIKSMIFFGIFNGRDCYCTPYFKPMASDSSSCDSACPGDPTTMCGGQKKSQIFSMHMCRDTDDELDAAKKAGKKVLGQLEALTEKMKEKTEEAEKDAGMMQKSFGAAGDPDISVMFQKAKAWAGKNLEAAGKGKDMVKNLEDLKSKTEKAAGKDLSKYDNLKKVEDIIREWTKVTAEAKKLFKTNSKMWNTTQPPIGDKVEDWDKTYYPIMYFVDKSFEKAPSTCSGDLVAEPTLAFTPSQCAAACDSLVGDCVGFSFFKGDSGVCFLYSMFKTAQYYTDCEDFLQTDQRTTNASSVQTSQPSLTRGFLAQAQHMKKAPFEAQCVAKLQFFEGTSLKPNIKCPTEMCLKKLTKANRCFKKP